MPRAQGKDLCELFGYAPDDDSAIARKQRDSQICPFIGGICIKHSHPLPGGKIDIFGSCSVANKPKKGTLEEVVICPQRLYANRYEVLQRVILDAVGEGIPFFMADEYKQSKRLDALPSNFVVLLGKNSSAEISLSKRDPITNKLIKLNLDWVFAQLVDGILTQIIPCEVQSIDITGNYHANWKAYMTEASSIPNSNHGLNWANVWKRLIPQLILKGTVAANSELCKSGSYFVLPERVYNQFENLVGKVNPVNLPGPGVLTIMTYELGPLVPFGSIRSLVQKRTIRMLSADFSIAFSAGHRLPLGSQLDSKVLSVLNAL